LTDIQEQIPDAQSLDDKTKKKALLSCAEEKQDSFTVIVIWFQHQNCKATFHHL
jgi:hypothetical protein